MSAAPRGDGQEPKRMSGKQARLLIVLVVVLVALLVFGYLLLVGGTVGD
jgi:flagellar basal body-associated protein FliL